MIKVVFGLVALTIIAILLNTGGVTNRAIAESVATLGPEWVAAPVQKAEYLHFVRKEADGSQSELIANKSVCQCQVASTIQDFKKDLASPGVSITINKAVLCGQPGERLVATGIAQKTNTQNNLEVWDFRFGPAIYYLMYLFRSDKPMPDAESGLANLCPSK